MKYNEDRSVNIKIDKLLKKIADLECTLGKDSTKKEFTKVKYKQEKLLEEIKILDVEFYSILNP